MKAQTAPKRRIEYLMHLTEMLFSGVQASLSLNQINLDGYFTDSELRLLMALREVARNARH
jgi:hypothetical protein